MDAAQGAANSVATGNVVLNIVLGSSLKLLWGLINTLQFIVFFTEWEVQMPANAVMAVETFRVIALGEFIPYDWLTEPMAEAFKSDDAEDGENGRSDVLSNMGVMLLALIAIIIVAVLVVVCVKYCKPGSKLHGLM